MHIFSITLHKSVTARARLSFLLVSVRVDRTEFLITHEEKFQPLSSRHARNVERASILIRQALRTDVLMQHLLVTAHEYDAGTKLLFQERLEEFEHHFEDEWLVDYV